MHYECNGLLKTFTPGLLSEARKPVSLQHYKTTAVFQGLFAVIYGTLS